ncbi:hypothetical protein E4U21_004752 [Claviceps maximensis]|nr:hypothetical protein E4U21_004752 [Claviceps maximensis]
MASSRRVFSGCLYGMLLAGAAAQSSQAQLCASVNTASNDPKPNTYQSVGACSSTCGTQYAYAVLQNNLCWCSNYGPDASTQSDGACHLPCPGYPADVCGGAGGLYSYVLLNAAMVRGTTGGDSDSGTETPNPRPRPSSPSKPPPQGPTSQPPATLTTLPSIHMQTNIINGIVQTVTVTPTDHATSSDPSPTDTPAPEQSPLSTGTLVGIVLGCILAAILAIGGTACLILSKKRTRRDNGVIIDDIASAHARGASSSTVSTAAMIKNPFADGPLAQGVYVQRDRAGSIETIVPQKEQRLRIVNPDLPET